MYNVGAVLEKVVMALQFDPTSLHAFYQAFPHVILQATNTGVKREYTYKDISMYN